MRKELSVIIPAYNEEEHLAGTVDEVVGYLRSQGWAFEVILVDDGSGDRTGSIMEDLGRIHAEVRPIRFQKNQGKGQAVKTGIQAARYAHCLFMDADNSTRITEWPKFERAFDEGARAVIASRRLKDSVISTPQPPARRILGGFYRFLCRMFFGLRLSDFNCGFKAYQTDLAKRLYARIEMPDWSFDVEALARLKKEEGVLPAECPVTWRHADKRSHLSPVKAGIRTFGSLMKLKRRLG